MNKLAVILGAALIVAIGAFFLFQDDKEVMTAGKSDKLKVGFVYLTNPGDHGWTYAHEVGRKQLQDHFGNKIETTFAENVPEGPDAARVIRDLLHRAIK